MWQPHHASAPPQRWPMLLPLLLLLLLVQLPAPSRGEGSCPEGLRHNSSLFIRPDSVLPLPHLIPGAPLTPDNHWYRGIRCNRKSEYPKVTDDCGPNECAFPGYGCYLDNNCTQWRSGSFDWSRLQTLYTTEEAAMPPFKGSIDQNGSFFKDKWVPQSGGPLKWYSPQQAARCLAGKRVTFCGDSMIRQLFIRLVFFLRGFNHFAEHYFHHAANYVYNGTHDMFLFAGHALPARAPARLRLNVGLPEAFEMEFLWEGHTLISEENALRSQPDFLIMSVMYWEDSDVLDNKTRPVLDFLSRRTDVRHTMLVAVPPLPKDNASHYLPVYTERNANMRKDVQGYMQSPAASTPHRDGRPPMTAVVVPLDLMTATSPYGRNKEDNTHYQCGLIVNSEHEDGWEVTSAYKSPENHDCRDMLNLNAIQLMLNHVCRDT